MDNWQVEYDKKRLEQLAKLQKRYPDLTVLTLLGKTTRAATYLVGVSDKDDYVVERSLYIVFESGKEYLRNILTSKRQKFLCVNGPRAEEKFDLKTGEKLGYRLYNNSSRPYRRSETKTPTAVLIWFGGYK